MPNLLTKLKALFTRFCTKNQSAQVPWNVGIGEETPIRTESQDRLRRTDFADRIAGVLSELSMSEGRVFAIRGGWGYGKSSLKHLICEKLDSRKKGADWVDFNPWQWGDGDAIARALFGQIADRLGGRTQKLHTSERKHFGAMGHYLREVVIPSKKRGNPIFFFRRY